METSDFDDFHEDPSLDSGDELFRLKGWEDLRCCRLVLDQFGSGEYSSVFFCNISSI